MAQLFSQGSSKGDRLAWVDTLTGAAETIVIGNLKARELSRLSLPTGAWGSEFAWSPDDSSLAVTTLRPLAVGMAGLGGSIIACCSIDHGIGATHLLIVPVDGSPVRDLLDDASEVAKDQAEPLPTLPPDVKTSYPAAEKAARYLGSPVWSADGRTILLTKTVCAATYDRRHHVPDCNSDLLLVDAETGALTVARVGTGRISAADLSPDGRHVAFVSGPGGEEDLLSVVDRDGNDPRTLGPAFGGLVDWSPDGKWLAFWRLGDEGPENGDRLDVWAMPSIGGAPQLVAEHASAGW
jgi:dipeptidyl aminopeptidase/acylaminoacyl peptidase